MLPVIVIPTYEEAANIERLLRTIRATVPELAIVVVDDNSPDGTGRIADGLAGELGNIDVLHRTGKGGLGSAYRHGFRHALDAGHDVVGQMDADFSHDPSVLPVLLETVAGGADVAIGSRYVPGGSVPNWTWSRRMLSQWGNTYARAMLRLRCNDATTAFRIYRSEVLEGIDIDGTTANGYLFQIETAFRLSQHDYRIEERPITFLDRIAGNSKMAVVRTMVETQFRVTWWGVALRAPALTGRVRRTPVGRFLEAKVRPAGRRTPPVI